MGQSQAAAAARRAKTPSLSTHAPVSREIERGSAGNELDADALLRQGVFLDRLAGMWGSTDALNDARGAAREGAASARGFDWTALSAGRSPLATPAADVSTDAVNDARGAAREGQPVEAEEPMGSAAGGVANYEPAELLSVAGRRTGDGDPETVARSRSAQAGVLYSLDGATVRIADIVRVKVVPGARRDDHGRLICAVAVDDGKRAYEVLRSGDHEVLTAEQERLARLIGLDGA